MGRRIPLLYSALLSAHDRPVVLSVLAMAKTFLTSDELERAGGYSRRCFSRSVIPSICLNGFADNAGSLSGGLSTFIMLTWDWQRRLVVYESLFRDDEESMMHILPCGDNCTSSNRLMISSHALDTSEYRTIPSRF